MEDLLQEETFKKSENYEEYLVSLRKIEEHVERARKVVHSMLGYARKMEPHLEDVDVNRTLQETIVFLENSARNNNIHISEDLLPKIPIISGNQSQLQQVFLNLLTNALDAIGKDGTIEVKTRMEGKQIAISIRDDGPGIPEEQQKKVFDPFFTTKEPGKGNRPGALGKLRYHQENGRENRSRKQDGRGNNIYGLFASCDSRKEVNLSSFSNKYVDNRLFNESTT